MSTVPEMVERVARAISIAVLGVDTEWRNSVGLARTAIAAMREPTEAMKATWGEDDYYESHLKKRTWHKMIAAALGEKP